MTRKQNISITIEVHEEDGYTYYLAKSDDLPGLIVEARSIEDIKAEVPKIAKKLMLLNKEDIYNNSVISFTYVISYVQLL